ncbi:MAG TPA: hypothetical protein PKV71_15970, partial [Calditrichia bacterium]|nr:hypothetical protein [Calditrichia bacterium]
MKELVSNFFSGRGKAISLFLLLSGLMMLSPLPGQELRDKFEGRHGEPRPNIEGTRGYSRFSKDILQSQGHARYLRFAQHDGNLVTGGVINSGLLSFSQVSNSPRISWPKGSLSASYIYGAYFYVAAEVTDANGDTIAIVSDNYRVNEERSPDGTHYYGTMPLPGYFNLDSPNATETPLVYGVSEDVGADGLYGTNDFGEGDGILQSGEDINGNGILDTRLQNVVNWLAITHRKETWPEYWPVGSYAGDPRQPGDRFGGPRAQKWNGEFGAYIRADQESYYVMDDRENDEFDYYPFGDPRPWPDGRRGLGITTEARVYQWNARLAEDIMIAIYDITNEGQDLDKVVVGMYVDPDMGGSFTNDDANFNDRDDITYTWNKLFLSSNGLPLGYFGFAFLESPGLSQDGIDNDGDGLVDESQQNGIDDDGDWIAGEDLNGNGVWDTEDVNYNGMLDPGEDIDGNGLLDIEPVNDDVGFDGLGPQFFGYPGPDEGEFNFRPDPFEPNFEFTDNDESDQVGLTSWYLRDTGSRMANDQEFWDLELRAGIFNVQEGYQRDIAFTYGSG